MATVVRARVAKIHARQAQEDWFTTATGIDVTDGLNHVFKALNDAADLATAIAFILSVFAPVGADSTVASDMPIGDLHALATTILATYPSGFIPATPL